MKNYADSYKDGMFGRIIPKHSLTPDFSGFGAFELGLRYSEFDGSDFTTAAQGCVAGSGCLTTPPPRRLVRQQSRCMDRRRQMDHDA